jgi:hypothetical protein
MRKFFEHLKNKFYYASDSIKNRYPCKIIKVTDYLDFGKNTKIIYQAVTRFNIRESRIDEILDDPMVVEKFHPTDCVKLGFLAACDILLKNNKPIEEIKKDYEKIAKNMLKDYEEDRNNDVK